jgi:hypothetical protein
MDGEQLIETAIDRVGVSDLGDDSFRTGLDLLVDGLETEAALNELGAAVAPETVVTYLATRLQLHDWHARHPDMGAQRVDPIVFMIGMGRTGTTIIHDLLGQDPANRVPLTWEVDRPFPPPESATYETDPRIAEVQAVIDVGHAARPEFRAMHPTGALLAQECIRMTGCELASLIFLSQFRLPTYMRWLTVDADMAPAYRLHKRFLQLLQWHHRGDRWIVKSGAHLWALPALMGEYPDARYLQTHRDPVKVIGSLSSLFATVRSTFSDDVTIAQVASDWADGILDALERSVDARESGAIPADRVIDVQFDAYMADPFGTLHAIYEWLDVELTPDAERRMRAFLAENAREKHGRHRYTFADTGLDEDALRERARRYTDYFDVPVGR